jgi:glucokinase
MNSPRPGASCLIGLDVGGTKIAAGLLLLPELRVAARRVVATAPERGGRGVLEEVLGLGRAMAEEAAGAGMKVEGIGLGICELVTTAGEIASANCIDWLGLPVRQMLERVAPAVIEADVRAAARAEACLGAGRGLRHFVYVTVGTGISCCLMVEGRPYLGARGGTGTLGSSPLSIACGQCGWVGDRTLEELASGQGLARRYAGVKPGASARVVLEAARAGERVAARIEWEALQALGSQLGLLVNLLDPEAVIMGGGLALSELFPWAELQRLVRRHTWWETHRALPMARAETGVDAGWMGAALAARPG